MIHSTGAGHGHDGGQNRLPLKVLMPAVILLLAAAAAGALRNSISSQSLSLYGASPSGVAVIDQPQQVERSREVVRAVLIDARPAAQYAAGHVSGALSVPYERRSANLSTLVKSVPAATPVIVYCESGCSSAERLAVWLKSNGWRNVAEFPAGFPAWAAAGLPVTQGEHP